MSLSKFNADAHVALLNLFRPSPAVNLNGNERRAYSISRAVLKAGMNESCFELDVSTEIERGMPAEVTRHGGIYVPTFMITRAGLDTETSTKGIELVFTEPGSLIEALRGKTRVLALGATFLPGLRNNVVGFPKVALGTESEWVLENPGVDVVADELTLAADNIILKPSALMSPSISFSRQLLVQSTPAIDAIVTGDIASANAAAIDKAALHGSGIAPEPEGIYTASGVSVVAFGGPITYTKVVEMETAVATVNGDVGPMGYISTPEVRGNARLTEGFPGSDVGPLWEGDNENGRMNYYSAVATNQVSKTLGAGDDEHGIIFGAWSDLIIGEWGATELIVDPFRLKKQGMIEVQSFALAGLALRHAESFAKGTALTVS